MRARQASGVLRAVEKIFNERTGCSRKPVVDKSIIVSRYHADAAR
jgi:hypothetical protein